MPNDSPVSPTFQPGEVNSSKTSSPHPLSSPRPALTTDIPMPDRTDAEAAIRLLIRWAGDDPTRPGLQDTPARVARAYEEWFSGYRQSAKDFLATTFDEIGSYDQPVELRDIDFHSTCEHHMAPIRGKVHVAYLPDKRVVGISKLARVVELFARRLQIQERMTHDIADTIQTYLQPLGVAVVVEAEHACMSTRGIRTKQTCMVTKAMLGRYQRDETLRTNFIASLCHR